MRSKPISKSLKARILAGALIMSCALQLPAVASTENPLRDYYSGTLTEHFRSIYPQSGNSTVNVDIPYGQDPRQKYDVYLPAQAYNAPIIVMVHGGGWTAGDKQDADVAAAKSAYWVSKGYIFISVNYRLAPQTGPLQQADDVAAALAHIQANAGYWGGNSHKMILMGYASGGHLAALLSSNPTYAAAQGTSAWAGTVVLDTVALDVPSIMNASHASLYDQVFGQDQSFWLDASPGQSLSGSGLPILLVCSQQNQSDTCGRAAAFKYDAEQHSVPATISQQALSPDQINSALGSSAGYTQEVDSFIQSLL